MNMDVAKQALSQYFGYDTFRLSQAAVIERTMTGKNTLVVMPTGGGKSLCYQLPAVLLKGLTVVISPLIALMEDQVTALRTNGIQAAALNSQCSPEEARRIAADVEKGTLRLLYVSPERAVSPRFIQWLAQQQVAQIAIDEAHCVSIWGNDFRPEYTHLTALTAHFPSAPIVALTATADTATQQEIRQRLNLDRDQEPVQVFVSSFERKNIHIDVLPANDRVSVIRQFLRQRPNEPGIVYCLSRKGTETMAQKLTQAGYRVAFYHGSMDSEARSAVQTAFLQDDIQIVCATIAFGMGVDKPNIRWVIHHNLPKNIESYYQEIGRAGRDGEPARALLFAGYGDMKSLSQFIDDGGGSEGFQQVQHAKLNRMWQFTQATSCRTNFILNYFGEYRDAPCGHCDRCLNPPEAIDGTTIAQMALSAVYRVQQRAGLNLLINILRGSSSAEVRQHGYHQIKTFGVGQEIDWKPWRHYITQLIDQGYLAIDFTRHSAITLTDLSAGVLKGEVSVGLCEYQEQDFSRPTEKKGLGAVDAPPLSADEEALFESLRALRKQLSSDAGLPAFTIFSDATLRDMARHKPRDEAAFLQVQGVGQHKCDQYARPFLSCINNAESLQH